MQLLPNGQLLVAGVPRHYQGTGFVSESVALLTATGARDPGFGPRLQATGVVNAVAQQGNGKLLIGGYFNEVNGVACGNVARLNANGSTDATFVPAAIDDEVTSVATQADGKVLAAGIFRAVGPTVREGLARLLPSGGLDTAFAPTLTSAAGTSAFAPDGKTIPLVQRVLVLPNGQIVVAGRLQAGPNHSRVVRLDSPTGQLDPTFRLSGATANALGQVKDALLQPNGSLVVLSIGTVQRFLPSGAVDPGFSYTHTITAGSYYLTSLAQDAAGRLYVGGIMTTYNGGRDAVRTLSNGSIDPAFRSIYDYNNGMPTARVGKLLVQPNGRLLVGGELPVYDAMNRLIAFSGAARFFESGLLDSTYLPQRGPAYGVTDMLIQADGAIVMAGSFSETVTGQVHHGLMRLHDANVLSVRAKSAGPATDAWPVPARGQLHLALAAEARPSRVCLLNALGQEVLTQAVTAPDVTLRTAGLRPGAYLLLVDYASGPVRRRIVLE
jgi:uncharacterized delta-60 repeat protein